MDNFKAVLHQVASKIKMDVRCEANGSHASYFIGKYGPYVAHGKDAAAEMALDDLLMKKLVDPWNEFNMLVLKRKIKAKYFDLDPVKSGKIHRAILFYREGNKILILHIGTNNIMRHSPDKVFYGIQQLIDGIRR